MNYPAPRGGVNTELKVIEFAVFPFSRQQLVVGPLLRNNPSLAIAHSPINIHPLAENHSSVNLFAAART
jgi:hypothetical protein